LKEPRDAHRPVSARLSANASSGPVSFEVAIDPAGVRPGRTVATLAARTRIRELEESPAWTKTRGSRQAHRKDHAVTREIVTLSTRYGVISRETSFVAVEHRETPVEEEIQLRKVPIALAAGWGSMDEPALVTQMLSAGPMPRGAAPPAGARSSGRTDSGIIAHARGSSEVFDMQDGADLEESEPSFATPEPLREQFVEDPLRKQMMALITQQRADGSWQMSDELEELIGSNVFAPGLQIADATPRLGEFRNVWATALALAWLERRAGHLRPEWQMVAEKGRRWLQNAVAELGYAERWVHEAVRFV